MFDKKNEIDALYIDLAKALDNVSRNKLIHKLNITGNVSELFWQNETNELKLITICHHMNLWVPQGTLVGPMSFIVYNNDVYDTAQYSTIYISLYTLFGKSNSIEDSDKIHDDILRVSRYFDEWQLKVNPSKCEGGVCMSLTRTGSWFLWICNK